MRYKVYQVDAFADSLFRGNPAAVCPLGSEWLPDSLMQDIAQENNLAETAFYIEKDGEYSIRWFTPETEVDLCGHATLASAHVLFRHEGYSREVVSFSSRSGPLTISRNGDKLCMDFPADRVRRAEHEALFDACFGAKPREVYKGISDYLFIFDGESFVRSTKPDLDAISGLDSRGVIASAKGEDVDFVSRCFFPRLGIDEDPVTGSAHTTLVPYWSKALGKDALEAMQVSKRGGRLSCRDLGERTEICGQAVTFFSGEMFLP